MILFGEEGGTWGCGHMSASVTHTRHTTHTVHTQHTVHTHTTHTVHTHTANCRKNRVVTGGKDLWARDTATDRERESSVSLWIPGCICRAAGKWNEKVVLGHKATNPPYSHKSHRNTLDLAEPPTLEQIKSSTTLWPKGTKLKSEQENVPEIFTTGTRAARSREAETLSELNEMKHVCESEAASCVCCTVSFDLVRFGFTL